MLRNKQINSADYGRHWRKNRKYYITRITVCLDVRPRRIFVKTAVKKYRKKKYSIYITSYRCEAEINEIVRKTKKPRSHFTLYSDYRHRLVKFGTLSEKQKESSVALLTYRKDVSKLVRRSNYLLRVSKHVETDLDPVYMRTRTLLSSYRTLNLKLRACNRSISNSSNG